MGRFSDLNKGNIYSLESRAYNYNNAKADKETIRLYGYNFVSLEDTEYEIDRLYSAIDFFNELNNDMLSIEKYQSMIDKDNLSYEEEQSIIEGMRDIYSRHRFMKPSVALESFHNLTTVSLEYSWDDFSQWISKLWDQVCEFFTKTETKISDRAHDEKKESTIEELVKYIKDNEKRLKDKTFDVVINEEGPALSFNELFNKADELVKITESSMTKLREVVSLVGDLKTSKDADQVNIKLTAIEKGRDEVMNKLADLKKTGKVTEFKYEAATKSSFFIQEGHKKWLETYDAFTKEMDEKIKDLKASIVDAAKGETLSDPSKTASNDNKQVTNMSPNDPKLAEARKKQAEYEAKQSKPSSSVESYGIEAEETTTTDSSTTESPTDDRPSDPDQDAKDDLAVTRMDAYNTSKQGATEATKKNNLNEGAKKFIAYLTKSMQLTLKDNNFYLDIKDMVFKFLSKWKDVATGDVGDINEEKEAAKKKAETERNNAIAKAEDEILKNKDKIQDWKDWLEGNKDNIKKTLEIKIGKGPKENLDNVFEKAKSKIEASMQSATKLVYNSIDKVKNGSLTVDQIKKQLDITKSDLDKAIEEAKKVGVVKIDIESALGFTKSALEYASGGFSKNFDELKSKLNDKLKEEGYNPEEKTEDGKDKELTEDEKTVNRRLAPLKELANSYNETVLGTTKLVTMFYDAFSIYMGKVQNGEASDTKEETIDKNSKKSSTKSKAKSTSAVSTDSYIDTTLKSIYLK